ncbi:FtsK/SpoIIIE domain-containing protein [Bacillus cereus group sp. TH150LC]|uniref:FtsK/SpoIIIE domain-containing protein n=1 Tax=Bacillus cereus group sp. TH150LC TaxID=3018061 RepID=UPI0022E667AC|nr:FtsK/SpoIIIE domain-containing protein [Bacillus cereus group sp. TH150LC]MDA1658340.1 FtsK/SpoIIIE domain-containing protein [Bacillus cereus group sp. TH150LC]
MIEKAIINSNLHIEEEDELINMPTYEIIETDYSLTVVVNGHLHKIEKDYEKAVPFFENAIDMDCTEWKYERGRFTITFSKLEMEADRYYKSNNPEEYLVLGIDGQRGEVRWEFNKFPHMLLIGAPGSGKSVMFKNVITQMGKDWELFFCDPKQVEFGELAYQGYRVAFDNEAIKNSIDQCVELMEERYTQMRENRCVKYTQLPEDIRPKPAFLIVDEFGAFFSLLPRKEADEYGTKLRILVQKGRAAGVQVCLLTQKASSKVMDTDTRDTIACSVAMGMNRPDSYDMAFGAEGRQLKPLTIGEGYYNIGTGIRKMKTYNLSDEEFIEYTS